MLAAAHKPIAATTLGAGGNLAGWPLAPLHEVRTFPGSWAVAVHLRHGFREHGATGSPANML